MNKQNCLRLKTMQINSVHYSVYMYMYTFLHNASGHVHNCSLSFLNFPPEANSAQRYIGGVIQQLLRLFYAFADIFYPDFAYADTQFSFLLATVSTTMRL